MKILVLTENDDCCGPMAAAFIRDYDDGIEAVSAGICPASRMKPFMVEVMKECFVDLGGYEPVLFDTSQLKDVDAVIAFSPVVPPACGCEVYALEMPELCDGVEAARNLRDRVKNEAFLVFRKMRSR